MVSNNRLLPLVGQEDRPGCYEGLKIVLSRALSLSQSFGRCPQSLAILASIDASLPCKPSFSRKLFSKDTSHRLSSLDTLFSSEPMTTSNAPSQGMVHL